MESGQGEQQEQYVHLQPGPGLAKAEFGNVDE